MKQKITSFKEYRSTLKTFLYLTEKLESIKRDLGYLQKSINAEESIHLQNIKINAVQAEVQQLEAVLKEFENNCIYTETLTL